MRFNHLSVLQLTASILKWTVLVLTFIDIICSTINIGYLNVLKWGRLLAGFLHSSTELLGGVMLRRTGQDGDDNRTELTASILKWTELVLTFIGICSTINIGYPNVLKWGGPLTAFLHSSTELLGGIMLRGTGQDGDDNLTELTASILKWTVLVLTFIDIICSTINIGYPNVLKWGRLLAAFLHSSTELLGGVMLRGTGQDGDYNLTELTASILKWTVLVLTFIGIWSTINIGYPKLLKWGGPLTAFHHSSTELLGGVMLRETGQDGDDNLTEVIVEE